MDEPRAGLRERKKERTRAEIQQQALRLFREHGFDAVSVQQIAAASEVAPSTVFRYFPTKEALLSLDGYYGFGPAVAAAFAEQPATASPIAVLRAAVRSVFAALSAEERAARAERDLGLLQVPELLAANRGLLRAAVDQLAGMFAARVGRPVDDPDTRVLADAVVGVAVEAMLRWAETPRGELIEAVDDALGRLDAMIKIDY